MKLYFIYSIFILSFSLNSSAQLRDLGTIGLKGLTSEQLSSLAKGDIVFVNTTAGNAGSKTSLTEAAIIFSAPPETAWKLISKTEDQPIYIDGCKEIKVTRTEPGKSYEVHKVGTFMITYCYGVIQNFVPESRCMYWMLDTNYEKNDLLVLNGYWQFYPYGNGKTLARYGSSISFKNLPEFIEKSHLKSGVEDALDAVRKYVDSGGTYRK